MLGRFVVVGVGYDAIEISALPGKRGPRRHAAGHGSSKRGPTLLQKHQAEPTCPGEMEIDLVSVMRLQPRVFVIGSASTQLTKHADQPGRFSCSGDGAESFV